MSDHLVNEEKNREHSPGEKFYTREVAAQYETLRQNDRYWTWENDVVDHCLRTFQVADKIADCPVGTGRFMDIYARYGLQVLGIDISPDMLNEAGKKVEATGLAGRVELIQADASSMALEHPVAEALVCFRLLHLISDNNLDDLIKGLSAIPSRYIFLQQFSVKDYNPGRVAGRVLHAIGSGEISFVRKLKYVYRTLRALIAALLGPREAPSANQHKENTFCDVTYAHPLPRILAAFAQHGFLMKDSFDFRDNAHLMGESGCYLSMVIVMQKAPPLGR
jgi:hypothetical protein